MANVQSSEKKGSQAKKFPDRVINAKWVYIWFSSCITFIKIIYITFILFYKKK